MKENAAAKNIKAVYSLKDLVTLLKRPRQVLLMVKAGQPVDEMILQWTPLLERGDLMIDGGNSFFQDTERRSREVESKGYLYIGTGISGGEEGALKGPSIMPGGSSEAYALIESIVIAISAKVNGDPCVTHIGPRGSGHYVKMIHNAIEYGDMQVHQDQVVRPIATRTTRLPVQEGTMPSAMRVFALSVLGVALSVGAVAQPVSPTPQMKQLGQWVGKWVYQEEFRAKPDASWEKGSSQWENRWLGEGAFLRRPGASRFPAAAA